VSVVEKSVVEKSAVEKWTILSPVAAPPAVEAAPGTGPFSLNRPIAGVHVGLRVDYAWLCYLTVIDEWEKLLRADGAVPHTLWVERSRDTTEKRDAAELRADIDEWSRLIDCGLAGLGN
jgi:hypothetical protein